MGPAWGGHLALDAIVAYVDEELSPVARRRALEHLARCPECAAEVVAQTQARLALRGSAAPSLPSSLLNSLRAIPTETELPSPPAGLAVSSDGQLVSVQRDPGRQRREPRNRRVRLGAGAVVTGLALGGLVAGGGILAGSGGPTPTVGTASLGGTSYLGGGSSTTVAGIGPAMTSRSAARVQPTLNASVGEPSTRATPSAAPTAAPDVPLGSASVRRAHR